MGWWSKVKSAVSVAVNKAKAAVEAAKKKAKEAAKKAARIVKAKLEKARAYAKKKAKEAAKKAAKKVKAAKASAKKRLDERISKAKDKVAAAKEAAKKKAEDKLLKAISKAEDIKRAIEEKAKETLDKVKEKVEALTWRDKLKDIFLKAALKNLPMGITPKMSVVEAVYTLSTGKVITQLESVKITAKIWDWIVPINVLCKLFLGKNIEGKPEEFGSVGDYAELTLALAIFVPAGKVGAVGTKLGIKAGTKLGLKGFMKFAVTKIDDAARLFSKLKVDDQAKLIGKLSKTDDGIKIINKLMAKKALNPTLVKPTISIVNAEIKRKILLGKSGWIASKIGNFDNLLRAFSSSPSLKFLKWAIIGTIGVDGMMAWLASDNVITGVSFTLRKLSDAAEAGTITKEEAIKQLDLIQEWKDTATNFVETSTIANPLLWMFRGILLTNAEKGQLDIDLERKKIEAIVGIIELPEKIKTMVRDIIDGDTIDTSLKGTDVKTGKEIKLPQYKKTGHARIRVVGINSPEKSPKGEILCTDVEIVKVEKKFADEARNRLLALNDKEITLKIDLENALDAYGRILAVIEYQGEDIGLRQIKEGLACRYFREAHKYVDEEEYETATLNAKDEGVGMWRGLEEVEKEEDKIKIIITSIPDNAKLFLDDIALHHNTPSDERELSDVLHLLTLGAHVLSATKAGLSAMEDIEIVKGDNGTIHLTLESEPIPEVPTEEEIAEEELEVEKIEEVIEEVKIEEEIIKVPKEAVKLADIPKEYTAEQEWTLKDAFAKILILTEGKEIMSEKERKELIESYNMHTDGQKEVLNLLWQDLTFYTKGRAQLSGDEFILLKEKYRMLGL